MVDQIVRRQTRVARALRVARSRIGKMGRVSQVPENAQNVDVEGDVNVASADGLISSFVRLSRHEAVGTLMEL